MGEFPIVNGVLVYLEAKWEVPTACLFGALLHGYVIVLVVCRRGLDRSSFHLCRSAQNCRWSFERPTLTTFKSHRQGNQQVSDTEAPEGAKLLSPLGNGWVTNKRQSLSRVAATRIEIWAVQCSPFGGTFVPHLRPHPHPSDL